MKANVKAMIIEAIEGLAKKAENGVYSIPEDRVAELQQTVEASEKFAVLEKDGKHYIVYKSKMRPSGAIAEYQIVKARKANEEAVKAIVEIKAKRAPKEKMLENLYWFTNEDGENILNDFHGTEKDAIEYAQEQANIIHEDIYINCGEDIVDFVYADKVTVRNEIVRGVKEKPEGLMGLTIAELRQKSKELGLPYMHKHRALNKAALIANIEACITS